MAREHVRLALSEDEIKALLPVLQGLLAEIGRIGLDDRGDVEPEGGFELERWPS
jgi:hypothetical protein